MEWFANQFYLWWTEKEDKWYKKVGRAILLICWFPITLIFIQFYLEAIKPSVGTNKQ